VIILRVAETIVKSSRHLKMELALDQPLRFWCGGEKWARGDLAGRFRRRRPRRAVI